MNQEPTPGDQGIVPNFSAAAAEQLAGELYGLNARAVSLPSYCDANFLLQHDSGRKFVLKIANSAEDGAVLACQNLAIEQLAAAQIAVPRVLTTLDGERLTAVAAPMSGVRHWVRLVTYLEGQMLIEIAPKSPHLLRQVGRFLGRLDQALSDFTHPAMKRPLVWDMNQALAVQPFLADISDPARRELAEWAFDRYVSHVAPIFPSLRGSVIHHDANTHNLLRLSAGPAADGVDDSVGIIDFGDLLHTATVCEIAIAMTYVLLDLVTLDQASPPEAAAAVTDHTLLAAGAEVLRGYHEVAPLEACEIERLYDLIVVRLGMSVALSTHRQEEARANPYLTVSEAPAWIILARLRALNPAAVTAVWRAACGQRRAWTDLGHSFAQTLTLRQQHLSQALSLAYQTPLKIVRGAGTYLFDEQGRAFLDAVNNVCHVGHCHPKVVAAAARQMAQLNTNTRYLHDHLVEYASRLTATLPAPLRICFFVCSGSEANDLALRLARAHTGHEDVVVVAGAYHGTTHSLIELSPYKFDGPGGRGAPPHVNPVPAPDPYRNKCRHDPQAGVALARPIVQAIAGAHQRGRRIAAFYCESMLSCGGQIVLPSGYLAAAYQQIRAAGGVCIADEVQVGFGRAGEKFWAFETQGVVPDIVTLGKPIGNGHPLAAVITTPEVARSFANGMEYFNTFGGNPVSCAVGLAVLEVIAEENLQARARHTGQHLLAQLAELEKRHALVGDVRGMGLFLGVELVSDRETLTPAAREAAVVVERMKERGILLSTDGPWHNVLKIKPPLVFGPAHADLLASNLDEVLAELDGAP